MERGFRLYVALVSLLVLGVSQAAAAPQILGVIASAEPVTLQCERGECGAEFTAFCVERYRKSPDPGTAYYVHDPDTIAFVGVRRHGATVDLDLAGLLAITTERGYSAVRMSLPESVLERFDLASVRVRVGANVTLIPEPVPGDPNPQTELDVLLASGPLRTVAAVIVDRGGERVDAARVVSQLANALPRRGRASGAARDRVWQAVSPPAGTPGYSLAREGFERCQSITLAGMQSLRQCLGSLHDSLIGELNTRYWHALELGS